MNTGEMKEARNRFIQVDALATRERWHVPHSVLDLLIRRKWQYLWSAYLGELIRSGAVDKEAVIRSRVDSRVILWRGAFDDALDVEVAPVEGFEVEPTDIVIMYRWIGGDREDAGS